MNDLREIDDENVTLPGQAGEIAEVIGRERTLFLLSHLRPCRKTDSRRAGASERLSFYVPKVMPLDHWIVRLMGYRDAERLRAAFGGLIMHPPKCAILLLYWRRRTILEMAARGDAANDIAAAVGVTARHVRQVLAEER